MANKFTRLYPANTVASGSVGVWKKLSTTLQLDAPTLSLDGDTLTITDDSGLAASFDVLVDGNVAGTVTTTAADLSRLMLGEGTYSIAAIAKADGYVDSETSETVEYTVESGGQTVEGSIFFGCLSSFSLAVVDNTKYWDGTLEYSTDNTSWSEWDGTTTLSADDGVLYMRGIGNTFITGENASTSAGKWNLQGSEIYCRGNIENLLDYATVANGEHPPMGSSCFAYMFHYSATGLVTAPELPATVLSTECYSSMFVRTSLTTVPELPATTLASGCYRTMFSGCAHIKISTEQTDEYTTAYRIPTSGTGTTATDALTNMFANTGGTFKGAPEINTTYYLHSSNSVV